MEFYDVTSRVFDEDRMEFTATVSAADMDMFMRDCLLDLFMQDGSYATLPSYDQLKMQLDQRFGKEAVDNYLKYMVLDRLANHLISQQDVRFLLEPAADSQQVPSRGEPFTFQAAVILRPAFTLSSYDPVVVDVDPEGIIVTDFEVENQLAEFAKNNVDYVSLDRDRGTELGDLIAADLHVLLNGEEVPGISGDDSLVQLDYQYMPRGFVDGLVGMVPGERRSFDFQLGEDERMDDDEDQVYHAEVRFHGFRREEVPVIDEAWLAANYPLAKTVDELREILRAQIRSTKAQSMSGDKADQVDAVLAQRLQGAIPDIVYTFLQEESMASMQDQLQQQGKTFKEWLKENNLEENKFRMQMGLEIRENLRRGLALDTLFDHLGMTLEEADLEAAYEALGPGHASEVKSEILRSGKKYIVEEAARRLKAHSWLMQTAIVR